MAMFVNPQLLNVVGRKGVGIIGCRRVFSAGCPHADNKTEDDALVKVKPFASIPAVPSMPFVGSYSALKDYPDMLTMLQDLRQTHGPIYHAGVPGIGDGTRGDMVVVSDPVEFTHVLQNEGNYPTGLLSFPMNDVVRKYAPKAWDMLPAKGLFSAGEEWRETRLFLNNGLFSPKAAKGYADLIAEAASRGASGFGDAEQDLPTWLSQISFDCFSSVYFGRMMHTAVPETADPDDLRFASNVQSLTPAIVKLSAWDLFSAWLGRKTSLVTQMAGAWDESLEYIEKQIMEFSARREAGNLTELEHGSYLYSALDRQREGGAVDLQELKEVGQVMLSTSVDTTSIVLGNIFLQLALHPECQERLAEELRAAAGVENGVVEGKYLGARKRDPNMQYMHAVIRECHRMRPALSIQSYKRPTRDIELCGYSVPAGTMVARFVRLNLHTFV